MKRNGRAGLKPVAVFRFIEDWQPCVVLIQIRERSQELDFTLKPAICSRCVSERWLLAYEAAKLRGEQFG